MWSFTDLPDGWRERAVNLRERFPGATEADIARALHATDGHAGKSVRQLERTLEERKVATVTATRPSHLLPSDPGDGRPSHLLPLESPSGSPSSSSSFNAASAVKLPTKAELSSTRWSTGRATLCLLLALLVSSLLTNALFFWVRSRSSNASEGKSVSSTGFEEPVTKSCSSGEALGSNFDTDGDGVPDHHDFCSTPNWISGKATDFDGDGCQDGIEDLDRDNDGVHDARDRCPMTPMSYDFVSNTLSDFDGDGCADSVEDTDNDNDLILNTADHCPKTWVGEAPDTTGCSIRQLKAPVKEEDQKWWEFQAKVTRELANTTDTPDDDESSWLSGWIGELKGAWAEILVGAILTTALTKVNGAARFLQDSLPKE